MTEQKCNDGHASYINQVAVLLIHDIHDSRKRIGIGKNQHRQNCKRGVRMIYMTVYCMQFCNQLIALKIIEL